MEKEKNDDALSKQLKRVSMGLGGLDNMPISFAKMLLNQRLSNPNKNSSSKSLNYSVYTKDNILSWLQSPKNNEKNIRNASNYLYISSMHYQRLIKYYAGLLTWAYVISPLNFNKSKIKDVDSFKKQYLKVAQDLELLNIPQTFYNIALITLREGAYYGVRRADKTTTFIQQIDADMCKIVYISDGVFNYAVDMSQIKEADLEFYPPEFTSMYTDYQKSGEKYQDVPWDISVCLKADETTMLYSIPSFAATLPSLYRIASAEANQEDSEEMDNYKMLAAEVPVDDDGQPKIGWALAEKYYSSICNAVGDKVGVSLTPFKLTSHNFDKSGSLANIDTLNRAISNYWTSAGTSGLLHGVPNDTSGVTKLSIVNDESFVMPLLKQAERVINRYLKANFTGTIKFKITFLPVTIFNRDEYIKMYKESVPFGIGKSHYLAVLGIPQFDVEGLSYLENDVLDLDSQLKPLLNSHNATAEELSSGRPAKDDGELTDSGETTRDDDTNSNR